MIQIHRPALPAETQTGLSGYQQKVDKLPTFAARVEAAVGLFGSRNRKSNSVFRVVRAKLTAMCHGARRCMYCEDAPADEVEHFRPKNLHPELVFDWSNYLYACGICNGPKNNKWGVLAQSGSTVTKVSRSPDSPVLPPPAGSPALIDPSLEEPLDYLFLDLQTLLIVPKPGISARDRARADYTIEILDLNKDFLQESRESAYGAYLSHLEYARNRKEGGETVPDHLPNTVRRTHHATVWAEMKRQHSSYAHLNGLFTAVPEALSW
jgi:uncharacterized protein (TIGR02646 family)